MQSSTPIEKLGLKPRSLNALSRNGYHTFGRLCSATERELLRLRWMGQISVNDIKDALKRQGAAFPDTSTERCVKK